MKLNPDEARGLIPALDRMTYFNWGSAGILPEPARAVVDHYTAIATGDVEPESGDLFEELEGRRNAGRASVAALINAHPDEVALVESTTLGLNIAALSLPLKRGDEVLLPDSEFIQVPIPWQRLSEERGVKVRFLHARQGRFGIDDIEAAMTRRTRVLTLGSVQWTSGFLCDLKAIGRLCRERDVYLVVDAIQHAGPVPLDVRKTPVDFIACGGYKWLNALIGCGFLYINKRRLRELSPPIRGYEGLGEPRGGWESYFQRPSSSPDRAFRFPNKASAFEVGGTPVFPGGAALGASVEILNALGPEVVHDHVQGLVEHLIDGLDRQGATVVSPPERHERSGIVVFRPARRGIDESEIVESLHRQRILLSRRYTSRVGGIRASIHVFNNADDIERLLGALRGLL